MVGLALVVGLRDGFGEMVGLSRMVPKLVGLAVMSGS